MTRAELLEAAAVLQLVADRLTLAAASQTGGAGADLRRACGDLSANASALVQTASVGAPLQECFAFAYNAGASLDALDGLRAALLAFAAKGWPAVAVAQGAINLALSGMARRMTETALRSRSDLESYLARINAAFAQAIDAVADQNAQESFRALTALHAATVQDLVRRGRTLPQVIPYKYGARRPALWMANRLYGDASRSDELVVENGAVHPLFMPATGRAFSV